MAKYKVDLDCVPMRVYIDITTGEAQDYEFEGMSVAQAADVLKRSYIAIVAGKRLGNEINQQNNTFNLSATITCIEIVENLILLQQPDKAKEVMQSLGYNLANSNGKQLETRIAAIKGKVKLQLFKAEEKQKQKAEMAEGKGSERDRFVKERVALMEYYKMHIDINVVTAAEYAYMIKRMSDEIERQMMKKASASAKK